MDISTDLWLSNDNGLISIYNFKDVRDLIKKINKQL